MTSRGTTWLWAAMLAVGLPVGAGSAMAQHASGESGRALDANPQVGSGGANRPEGQIDYRLRNEIVTGNVAGGRQFRGEVDYGGVGDFRGPLGSDETFRFQADSLPSSLPAVRSLEAGVMPPITVFRSQSATSVGDLVIPVDRTMARPSGYDAALQLGDLNRISAEMTAPRPDGGIARPIGLFETQDGRLLEVTVSPLLGVRQDRVERPTERFDPAQLIEVEPEIDPDAVIERALRLPEIDATRRDEELTAPQEMSAAEQAMRRERQQPGTFTPTLELGMRMLDRVEAPRLGEEPTRQDHRIARLEQAMLNPMGSRQYQPGEDVYMDLLAQLRGDMPVQAREVDTTDRPSLETPTLEELREAERERLDALRAARAARGLPVDDLPSAEDPADADQPEPDADNGDAAPSVSGAIEQLMQRLSHDLPPLETLVGERQTRTNHLLRAAEADLAGGRYLDAETKYRQVLSDIPEHPMARVGMVHAQLGAGMIRSSAINLRRLFERHPELIATRYAPRLLPNQERMDFIHGELQKQLQSAQKGDAALLTAYLGYQLDSRQLTRYGLALAEAASPHDPLMPVLRHIWLSDAGRESADDASPHTSQGRDGDRSPAHGGAADAPADADVGAADPTK